MVALCGLTKPGLHLGQICRHAVAAASQRALGEHGTDMAGSCRFLEQPLCPGMIRRATADINQHFTEHDLGLGKASVGRTGDPLPALDGIGRNASILSQKAVTLLPAIASRHWSTRLGGQPRCLAAD
jgi:hypothetical protein